MAENKNDQVIVAIFDSNVAADKAVALLQEWDDANDEIKLGAVGTILLEKGKVKTKVGNNTGKGAVVGTVIGVIAAVLMGPLALLGGAIGGAIGGGVVGAFMKKSTHLSKEEIEEIGKELSAGGVAVVVTCDDFEVAPTRDQLISAGGKVRNYVVPQEAISDAAEAVAGADAAAVAEAPAEVVSTALAEANEATATAADAASDAIQSGADAAGDAMGSAADAASDAMGSAADAASDAMGSATDKTS